MDMKRPLKKLTLNRETVRQLSAGEMSRVAGGAANTQPTDLPFCVSDALSCTDWCNVDQIG
jgi:natural product precursor